MTIAFGAGKPEDVKGVIGSADGLVIGSGVVEFIGAHGPDAEPEIVEYIQKIAKEVD
ncbi:MAG: tryptophan synthase subunit alpha [Candidatus Methanomethylophilaceae archaeon]|nr:tryptophan synthase subunit alpha [Candidatus Methanomethylophilaceae archaeon]